MTTNINTDADAQQATTGTTVEQTGIEAFTDVDQTPTVSFDDTDGRADDMEQAMSEWVDELVEAAEEARESDIFTR